MKVPRVSNCPMAADPKRNTHTTARGPWKSFARTRIVLIAMGARSGGAGFAGGSPHAIRGKQLRSLYHLLSPSQAKANWRWGFCLGEESFTTQRGDAAGAGVPQSYPISSVRLFVLQVLVDHHFAALIHGDDFVNRRVAGQGDIDNVVAGIEDEIDR